jgi:hypothetical protein
MKLTIIVASLLATGAITASSGYAQHLPSLQGSPPGNGSAAASPSAPPGAPIPNAGEPDSGNPSEPLPLSSSETLDDCMSFWDPGTHMSKSEWRQACQRTQNGRDF